MKTMMTMAAIAALSVAAPAAAQPWSGGSQTADLQRQLQSGMSSGAITFREARPLQASLRQLIGLERQFSRNGFTGRENATLRQHTNLLRRDIRLAERNGARGPRAAWDDRDNDRAGWDDRDDRDGRDGWNDRRDDRDGRWGDGRDGYAMDSRFDRPNRGDRFSGDPRVGHHATLRMVALPDQFRDQFRDTNDVYYRFDGGRIYRINRATNMILGLFDI
jgi:hypothetical protein